MTAVDLTITSPSRFDLFIPWVGGPSFKQRVERAGIKTVPDTVWKSYMDETVWPNGTNIRLRTRRVLMGLENLFWLGYLFGGGKQSSALNTTFWTLIVALVAGIATPIASIFFDGMSSAWMSLPMTWLALAVYCSASELSGNPHSSTRCLCRWV